MLTVNAIDWDKADCTLYTALADYRGPMDRDVWDKLAEYGDWEITRAMAHNPNCPFLNDLADSDDWDIRNAVAENPAYTDLAYLASDDDHLVRQGVARNPNCPAYLLELLCNDPEGRVGWTAYNSLRKLSESEACSG